MKRPRTWGGVSAGCPISVRRIWIGFVAFCLLIGSALCGGGATTLDNPTAFFTNVAARLLGSELNMDLNSIQVYPTNQYTPSVHRLLQVTANIYDAATNRTYGIADATNGFPSVFRPIFRQIQTATNTVVIIAGYREVSGTGMADPTNAPAMIDLDSGGLSGIPALGTPFDPNDRLEPMVSGVPLIVGARASFPNFNEFAMQPYLFVSRLLEFRRAPGDAIGPIVQTNQMYVVAITNIFGLEAWNSYSNPYPRNLQLIASATITATMTNESGNVILSNSIFNEAITNVVAGSWPGWTNVNLTRNSFVLPWGSGGSFLFLTNSTYINQPPWFEPQTHIFTIAETNAFYVPHWWLNLKSQVLFILVDTDANRIVDYVNLKNWEPTLDITSQLMAGAQCTGNPSAYSNPAEQWCTNRLWGTLDPRVPTIGVLNQIAVGVTGTTDWNNFSMDPYVGQDTVKAMQSFRYNLMNLTTPGVTFAKSNIFYAPFDPYKPIFVQASFEANDPLLHYTIDDLIDLSVNPTNLISTGQPSRPWNDLGQINKRYAPWGGHPYGPADTLDTQIAVKDPFVIRSDCWDFPNGAGLDLGWIGQVHRGTPWQTVFLKSTNILTATSNLPQNLITWQIWTGNAGTRSAPSVAGGAVADALYTTPTNDWQLVSVLAPLFSTNDFRSLASVNQTRDSAWLRLLDGMTVLTDNGAGQLQPAVMSGSSLQAASIAVALDATRATQPRALFDSVGSILATPELSLTSPWLNTTNQNTVISDQAFEIIPSQLLRLLRPDSIGTIVPAGGGFTIRFSGIDGYAYGVQVSSDLNDWSTFSTNYSYNGTIDFFAAQSTNANAPQTFYRTVLLP